jgi:hypothetical protein
VIGVAPRLGAPASGGGRSVEFLSLCWRVFWLWYNEPRHARRIRELRASIDRLERELFPEWFSLGGGAVSVQDRVATGAGPDGRGSRY